jgi:PST family polysaccharide transporter
LLGVLSTNEETGLYSLSQKLTEVLFIIPVIVVDVLYPQLIRNRMARADELDQSQTFYDIAIAAAIVATLGAVVIVSLLVPVLFGAAYSQTVAIFQIHAWTCIGIAMHHSRYKWMAANGHQNLAPIVAMFGLILAIPMHLIFIPVFDGIGAAIATALAFLLSGHLASYLFPALRPTAAMQTRALWPWYRLWVRFR